MAYSALKLLHAASGLLAFGASLTYGFWAMRGAREPRHEGFVLRGLLWMDTWLVNPAFCLAGLSGAALLLLGGAAWDAFWVRGSLALFLLTTALSWAVYRPLARRQWAAYASGGGEDARYRRLSAWSARLGLVFGLANAGLVFLMVLKPAGL